MGKLYHFQAIILFFQDFFLHFTIFQDNNYQVRAFYRHTNIIISGTEVGKLVLVDYINPSRSETIAL